MLLIIFNKLIINITINYQKKRERERMLRGVVKMGGFKLRSFISKSRLRALCPVAVLWWTGSSCSIRT